MASGSGAGTPMDTSSSSSAPAPKKSSSSTNAQQQQAGASGSSGGGDGSEDKMFTLKKWHGVTIWRWDTASENCAICRSGIMDACLRCQAEGGNTECLVVWGDCGHSYHSCCMNQWLKQTGPGRCPLCQSEWVVQKLGK